MTTKEKFQTLLEAGYYVWLVRDGGWWLPNVANLNMEDTEGPMELKGFFVDKGYHFSGTWDEYDLVWDWAVETVYSQFSDEFINWSNY